MSFPMFTMLAQSCSISDRRLVQLLSATALWLGSLSPALAGPHHGDVILLAQSGRVVTGLEADAGLDAPHRVFPAEFGEILPNQASEPGFESVPDQFATNAQVDLRIRRALHKWSDADSNFCAIATEAIEIRKSTQTITTPATDPADPTTGPAITIGVSDPVDGLIHQHAVFELLAPHADGVYLLELQIEASPLSPSDPVWFVFNQNADEATHDRAVHFVERTLAADGASGNLCRCPSDLDDNGTTDLADLVGFLSDWQPQIGQMGEALEGDRNADGAVDLADLVAFLTRWQQGC